MNAKWRQKVASKLLCKRVMKSFGMWHTLLPKLPLLEQVLIQLLSPWFYQIGIPRAALSSLPVDIVKILPWPSKFILELQIPSHDTTLHQRRSIPFDGYIIQFRQSAFRADPLSGQFLYVQNMRDGQFKMIKKAPIRETGKDQSSFCNMDNQFIFITGGKIGDRHRHYLDTVERYDISRDVWKEMPRLNVPRESHGSCALGTAVYVICGGSSTSVMYSSQVEVLETRNHEAGWKPIDIPSSALQQRWHPVVGVVYQGEILIMGGRSIMDGNVLGDAQIFHVADNSIETIIADEDNSFKFINTMSSATQLGPDQVIACVFSEEDQGVNLIEYNSGSIERLLRHSGHRSGNVPEPFEHQDRAIKDYSDGESVYL